MGDERVGARVEPGVDDDVVAGRQVDVGERLPVPRPQLGAAECGAQQVEAVVVLEVGQVTRGEDPQRERPRVGRTAAVDGLVASAPRSGAPPPPGRARVDGEPGAAGLLVATADQLGPGAVPVPGRRIPRSLDELVAHGPQEDRELTRPG